MTTGAICVAYWAGRWECFHAEAVSSAINFSANAAYSGVLISSHSIFSWIKDKRQNANPILQETELFGTFKCFMIAD